MMELKDEALVHPDREKHNAPPSISLTISLS